MKVNPQKKAVGKSARSMMAGNRAVAAGKRVPYGKQEMVRKGMPTKSDRMVAGNALRNMSASQMKRMQENRMKASKGKKK